MKYCVQISLLFGILATSPVSAQSLIPINVEAVKKAVVFLHGADSTGEVDVTREIATGFLVMIPSQRDPNIGRLLLVTARHVVDPVWGCIAAQNPTAIYARVNRKIFDSAKDVSGVAFIKLSLVINDQPSWVTHPSDRVDAAILRISSVDANKFLGNDVGVVSIADFGTPEEIRSVGIGSDIVSAGLVPGFSGRKRNYPFFKFGKVSNVPDEEGVMPCGQKPKPAIYWYIAATLVAGNSGSPIFVLPPGNAMMRFGNTRPFLLGLQSMSLIAGEIAGMVPTQYIFEIIEALNLSGANLTRGPAQKPAAAPSPEVP